MAPRTPVLRPDEYFERNGFDTRPAFAVVGVTALVAVGPVLALGAFATEQFASAGGDATGAVWFFVLLYVGVFLSGVVTAPLVSAVVLHVLARAACDNEGQFEHTLVVASWGLLPAIPVLLAVHGSLGATLADATTVTPKLFLGELFGTLVAPDAPPLAFAAGFLVAGWETYLYGYGLSVAFDADLSRSLVVGGVVAFGGWLLSLF